MECQLLFSGEEKNILDKYFKMISVEIFILVLNPM